jgi:diketogulonate reductase-like aldo/keto reductase
MCQFILRWNLQKGVITIPKSVHAARISSNADIFDFELSTADIAFLDGFDRNEQT